MSSQDEQIDTQMPDNLESLGFDEWKLLHEKNPSIFDDCRLKMLNDLIDSAPEKSRPRLEGLLFQMEGESKRSKSQFSYNMRLSAMMMDMLDELRRQLTILCTTDLTTRETEVEDSPVATVIPFERPPAKQPKKPDNDL
ncbi:MAG: hypothetical protein ACI8XC_003337 [Gammaproteobacteria bacterium]|jgi:hypothetical protein